MLPHPLTAVLFLGCPPTERGETARALGAAGLSVLWAEDVAGALGELQRGDVPVVVDLSYGDPALQHARELKSQRTGTLLFAVVDPRRADLTIGAIALGVADVFARPLGGHRLAAAIQREARALGPQAPLRAGSRLDIRANGARGAAPPANGGGRGNGAPAGPRRAGAPRNDHDQPRAPGTTKTRPPKSSMGTRTRCGRSRPWWRARPGCASAS